MSSPSQPALWSTLLRCAAVVALLSAAAPPLSAQDTEASIKASLLALSKEWIEGRIFTFAFQVHEKQTSSSGQMTNEEISEVRLTIDPATGRYIAEKLILPSASNKVTRFILQRWDGKTTAAGTTLHPNLLRASIVDAPIGQLSLDTITLYPTEQPCGFADLTKRAAGLTLDGRNLIARLAMILADPKSRATRDVSTPDEDITITWEAETLRFDARHGFLRESVDEARPRTTLSADYTLEQTPSEITVHWGDAPEAGGIATEYKAIPDRCGFITRERFQALLHEPFLPGTTVIDKITGRTYQLPAPAARVPRP